VEIVLVGVGLLVVTMCFILAASRRMRPGPAADPSDAVRRDLERLVDELKIAVRDQVERLDREVRRLKEAVGEAEKARIALEEASRPAAPPSARPAPDRPANPLHSRVFELRDSGKDPTDIGVETGLEVGEVELILGLRRMPPRA